MTKQADRILSKRNQALVWLFASLIVEGGANLVQAFKSDPDAGSDPVTWLLFAVGVAMVLRQTFGDSPAETEADEIVAKGRKP